MDLLELSDDENTTQALAATLTGAGCVHARINAATALAGMSALPARLGDLHGAESHDRILACVAHAAEGNGEIARLRELALRDPDARVREAAVEALASHAEGDEALREVAEHSDDRALVLQAVRALGAHAAYAHGALTALVDHPDVEVALAAFAALRCSPAEARVQAARALLDRDDERARILALVALSDVGDDGDLPRVELHLRSDAARVRSAAIEARAALAAR